MKAYSAWFIHCLTFGMFPPATKTILTTDSAFVFNTIPMSSNGVSAQGKRVTPLN